MDTAQQTAQGIPLPQVNFSTFILSLASSTLVQLGEVPNPETNALEPDVDMAHHSIGILEMLQEKTAGNLSPEEQQLLEGVLYEVRMKYVIKTS